MHVCIASVQRYLAACQPYHDCLVVGLPLMKCFICIYVRLSEVSVYMVHYKLELYLLQYTQNQITIMQTLKSILITTFTLSKVCR